MKRRIRLVSVLKAKILLVHRWLGLLSGIIVLVVALSGCLYVFEEEIRNTFYHNFYYVQQRYTAKRTVDDLKLAVVEKFPKEKIASIRFKEQADATYLFLTKKDNLISVNPYTGEVVGSRNNKEDFLGTVLRLHRTLLLGDVGKQIIKWNVLIFFILCISGLVLWWPRKKRLLKRAVSIPFRSGNWKVISWKLHTVLGFYALLILLMISLTGLFFSFDTVKDIVKSTTHYPLDKKEEKIKSRPAAGVGFSLNKGYQQIKNKYPDAKETIIALPADSLAPIRITMLYNYALVRKMNVLFFDQYSGQVLKENLFKDYTAYDKVSRSNYQLHTGNIPVLGLGSKLIYFLASLFAASLPITGFLMWWWKKK